jgi:hypothetical protein
VPAAPKPRRPRRSEAIEDLLRRASAAVDRKDVRVILGRFRPTKNGRKLTKIEWALMAIFTVGLALLVLVKTAREPVSAHASYYQSLALSLNPEAVSPRAFLESGLLSIGHEWRPASFFAGVHPLYWASDSKRHANERVRAVEEGLGRLGRHGRVLSVTTFGSPAFGNSEIAGRTEVLTFRANGQLELADGTVVRFSARLVQDEANHRWGFLELSLPPLLR